MKKDPSIVLLDIKTCSWPQVMKELSKAEAFHQNKYLSRFGPVLKCIRSFKKYASTMSQWIDILPAGDYGSGLCGMNDQFLYILGPSQFAPVVIRYDYTIKTMNRCFQIDPRRKNRWPTSCLHHAHVIENRLRVVCMTLVLLFPPLYRTFLRPSIRQEEFMGSIVTDSRSNLRKRRYSSTTPCWWH